MDVCTIYLVIWFCLSELCGARARARETRAKSFTRGETKWAGGTCESVLLHTTTTAKKKIAPQTRSRIIFFIADLGNGC